ncbi:brinker DNA-binding domain protein [Cooperia oncophora]
MSLDTVRRWYRRFRHGYESVDYRKKGPVKVDDDLLEEMANTKMSASEMAKFFGVQIATINMHLKNISQGRKTTFLNRQKLRDRLSIDHDCLIGYIDGEVIGHIDETEAAYSPEGTSTHSTMDGEQLSNHSSEFSYESSQPVDFSPPSTSESLPLLREKPESESGSSVSCFTVSEQARTVVVVSPTDDKKPDVNKDPKVDRVVHPVKCERPKARKSYTAEYKLNVINHVKLFGTSAAANDFGLHRRMIQRWKAMEEKLSRTNRSRRAFRGGGATQWSV